MPRLSWNEIQDRAATFAGHWTGETYEKGESQTFWSEFLDIFEIDRRRHGAFFEYAIKKGSGKQGFIDLFWPGKLLAEQKSGGGDTARAKLQAYEYLETMPDHDLPQAIVVGWRPDGGDIGGKLRSETRAAAEDVAAVVRADAPRWEDQVTEIATLSVTRVL